MATFFERRRKMLMFSAGAAALQRRESARAEADGFYCVAAAGPASDRARCASTSPEPNSVSCPAEASGLAVEVSRLRSAAGVSAWPRSSTSAATPETSAAETEVPVCRS